MNMFFNFHHVFSVTSRGGSNNLSWKYTWRKYSQDGGILVIKVQEDLRETHNNYANEIYCLSLEELWEKVK